MIEKLQAVLTTVPSIGIALFLTALGTFGELLLKEEWTEQVSIA